MSPVHSRLPEATLQLLSKMRRHLQSALTTHDLPLGPPEAHLLHLIEQTPGVSPLELAALTGHDKGFVARKIKALEQGQLIVREQDSTDNRRFKLKLTEDGARACLLVNQARQEAHAAVFAALSAEEQQQLARLISKCL